jgi:hypothetical protein
MKSAAGLVGPMHRYKLSVDIPFGYSTRWSGFG